MAWPNSIWKLLLYWLPISIWLSHSTIQGERKDLTQKTTGCQSPQKEASQGYISGIGISSTRNLRHGCEGFVFHSECVAENMNFLWRLGAWGGGGWDRGICIMMPQFCSADWILDMVWLGICPQGLSLRYGQRIDCTYSPKWFFSL